MIARTNAGAEDDAMIHDENAMETLMAVTAIDLARTVKPMPLR